MQPKYLTIGIITSILLCYVYDLTYNQTNSHKGKEKNETLFAYESDNEEETGESSNT